jgi:hypothetical protein
MPKMEGAVLPFPSTEDESFGSFSNAPDSRHIVHSGEWLQSLVNWLMMWTEITAVNFSLQPATSRIGHEPQKIYVSHIQNETRLHLSYRILPGGSEETHESLKQGSQSPARI